MYRLMSKTPHTRSIANLLAAGGQELRTSVLVRVNDNGTMRELEFATDPTDQEILDRLPSGVPLIPTAKVDWERAMGDAYGDWLRWKTTRLEATARAAPPAAVLALTGREDAAWDDYLQAIQAWRQAV